MMLGLRKDTVILSDFDKSWRRAAEEKRKEMKHIFGKTAIEIIHIGSTSIKNMKALPIIDIMVVVRNLDHPEMVSGLMEKHGYEKSEYASDNELVFYCGNQKNKFRTFFIHIVLHGSMEYFNHLNFRDYLNVNTMKRREYEALKLELAKKYPKDLQSYYDGKKEFYQKILKEAFDWKTLGKTVTVTVDKPLNSKNPVNEGFLYGLRDCTGKWQQAFILGENKPVHKFYGKVTAVIHDRNSYKTYWVVSSVNKIYYEPEIKKSISFAERFSNYDMTCLYEKSCGAVVYFMEKGEPFYLLVKNRSRNIGFPKGHMELGETERQTAEREILEETNVHVKFDESFREFYNYNISFFVKKQAVYFLGKAEDGNIAIPEDILSYHIASFREAMRLLSFTKERNILKSAHLKIISSY